VSAYYNEFDPKAAAWLRQLIKNGMIADGEVDERSITEVTADEIRGFTQHHFFAGIGGWSHSLRLAGWADDRAVCTASLPCQPFSVAGAQKGVDDERHLLPHFIQLVKQCNFQTIFGEQVPGAIKHGWLDDLCTEMERENYAVGSIVLTAAGTGAPHIRQRLYWVADSINKGSQGRLSGWQDTEREIVSRHSGCSGTVDGMENSISNGQRERPEIGRGIFGQHKDGETCNKSERRSEVCRMVDTSSDRLGRWDESERRERNKMLEGSSSDNDGLGNNSGERLERSARQSVQGSVDGLTSPSGRLGNTEHDGQPASSESRSNATSVRHSETRENSPSESTGASTPRIVSEWTDPDWLYCRDEKYRPIKSSIEPLVDGPPRGMGYSGYTSEPIEPNNTQEARVMRLKGYGNAIVPQVAASFIKAFMATQ